MKKFAIILLSFALLCGGIWCASYISSEHTGCHSDAYSVMCAKTLEHGSIMSGALLIEIFVLTIALFSLIRFAWHTIAPSLNYSTTVFYKAPHIIPRSSLTLAFARGIVNPRKP